MVRFPGTLIRLGRLAAQGMPGSAARSAPQVMPGTRPRLPRVLPNPGAGEPTPGQGPEPRHPAAGRGGSAAHNAPVAALSPRLLRSAAVTAQGGIPGRAVPAAGEQPHRCSVLHLEAKDRAPQGLHQHGCAGD